MNRLRSLCLSSFVAIALLMAIPAKADVALGLDFAFPDFKTGLHGRIGNLLVTSSYFFDSEIVGLSLNYIVWSYDFSEEWHFYVAPGLYGWFTDPFIVGANLPLGIMWNGPKWLEVYVQAVPSVPISPSGDFDVGGTCGFRFVL